MAPQTIHRDAVALVADHLRAVLPALGVTGPVVGEVPDPRPDRFTVVSRVGGVARNRVTDGPMLTFDSWAPDKGSAMDAAQIVRAVVADLPGEVLDGSSVYRVVEIAGPNLLPLPDTPQPRVTFTAEVWVRGEHPAA